MHCRQPSQFIMSSFLKIVFVYLFVYTWKRGKYDRKLTQNPHQELEFPNPWFSALLCNLTVRKGKCGERGK